MSYLRFKQICFLWIALFTISIPLRAFSAPLKILFFYPGGQGDQQSAQPVLDGFAEALKRNSGGTLDAKVFYISDSEQGKNFIQNEKPQGAILSLDAFQSQGSVWGAKVIAKTLQLPAGDGSDQYFIMGKKGTVLPSSGALELTTSRDLGKDFLVARLFPQLKSVALNVQASQNSVGTLRAIGEGKKSGFVLLDRFEHNNISKLKTPWASELAVIAQSPKVSSAPFVVFSANTPADIEQALQTALVKMAQDPAAKETLATLRLKGFQVASDAN